MGERDEHPHILGDWDRVFDALADPARRYLIQYLHARETPVSLTELTAALAGRVLDIPPNQVDTRTKERTAVGVVEEHLPKLEAANLVSVSRETVTLTEHAEQLPLFTSTYRGVVRPREENEG
ncbi:winged helix-turn-helix domain-containing protein [Haloferax namakaokahaiae]|uniref:Winged helix-turn-helix domain-containing protein n=1 Tax=Haloferax namakaokahaiae TaxID=1748331 RepID=A0ABD5ZHX7_9EURY